MTKYNYYLESLKELEVIRESKEKPRLLLHACCAPCSCYVLELLVKDFDLTVFFSNSNIYPYSEYDLRLNELKDYLVYFNQQYQADIKLVEMPYDKTYQSSLEPFALEPEGGKRCHLCYSKRILDAYKYASNHNYDYVTTVMTISRQKNSQVLNQIGGELEKQYPEVKYFYSDFKKKDGLLKRNKIVNEHNMYNQQYCGCKYSWKKYQLKQEEEL